MDRPKFTKEEFARYRRNDFTEDDIYEYYRKHNKKSFLFKLTYNKVKEKFFKELWRMIIEEDFTYILPGGMGHLFISSDIIRPKIVDDKLVVTRGSVDYGKTKKYNKENAEKNGKNVIIIHENYHTDQKRYYMTLARGRKKYYMRRYQFEACSMSKKNFAKSLFEGRGLERAKLKFKNSYV